MSRLPMYTVTVQLLIDDDAASDEESEVVTVETRIETAVWPERSVPVVTAVGMLAMAADTLLHSADDA